MDEVEFDCILQRAKLDDIDLHNYLVIPGAIDQCFPGSSQRLLLQEGSKGELRPRYGPDHV